MISDGSCWRIATIGLREKQDHPGKKSKQVSAMAISTCRQGVAERLNNWDTKELLNTINDISFSARRKAPDLKKVKAG